VAAVTLVLDANVLIAHFQARDSHHAAAAELLADHAGEGLMVHPLTLAEILVGSARLGRGAERQAVIAAMGIETATMDVDSPLRLAELRAGTGRRMPDCCVLDAAHHSGAIVATFDPDLAKTATLLGLRVVPS